MLINDIFLRMHIDVFCVKAHHGFYSDLLRSTKSVSEIWIGLKNKTNSLKKKRMVIVFPITVYKISRTFRETQN